MKEKADNLGKRLHDNKEFVESEAGPFQYEDSIVWKNTHANQIFPTTILQSSENCSSNLNSLAPLQESFEGFTWTD